MSLSAEKEARIEAMGGRVTTVEEWLDLTPEEVAIIDMKIRLGEELKAQRKVFRLTPSSILKEPDRPTMVRAFTAWTGTTGSLPWPPPGPPDLRTDS